MRKALVIILIIATVFEVGLGLGILLIPRALMGQFNVAEVNNDILYLAAIIGWFCLSTAAFAALSVRWLLQMRPEGRVLAIALGIFWLAIGLHLGLAYDRPQHLALDAAKGLIILILALLCRDPKKSS